MKRPKFFRLVVFFFLSASECQIQALDNLPCGKEKIFLESEELEKLDMFIVGKLFKIFGVFFVYMKNSWVNMNCDLQNPSQKLKLLLSCVSCMGCQNTADN